MIGIVEAIGAALAAIVAALAWGWRMRAKGRREGIDARRQQEAAGALERERNRNEIDRSTGGADARDRLHDDWRR
jgi:ribosomal protein S3